MLQGMNTSFTGLFRLISSLTFVNMLVMLSAHLTIIGSPQNSFMYTYLDTCVLIHIL